MKLSNVQIDVLNKMAGGWELAKRDGWCTHAWIDSNKTGPGRSTLSVRVPTVDSLQSKNLIEIDKYGKDTATAIYKLTDKGKEYALPQ